MKQYVLSIDQSTQGTKALLFSKDGRLLARCDRAHRQLIDEKGWVSHDPEEIYQNLLAAVQDVMGKAEISPDEIACLGLSNQRETSLIWERDSGKPLCNAVVWQCARAEPICDKLYRAGAGELVRQTTGLPLSPYFPAAKFAWILETIPEAKALAARHALCFGTMDAWLIYRLTDGKSYKTDASNASRTQLFDLRRLRWSEEVCSLFEIDANDLPEVCASDACFGETDLNGMLPRTIPIHAVLGDSHAALFAQGCHSGGMTKATYGTGSSAMMNVGAAPVFSRHGLVSSLAWNYCGQIQYVLEGNINYAGAVIRWLEQDIGLIQSPQETQALAEQADPEDCTYLVPAFTGLGAPYWASTVRAMICGMSRLTGRKELVRAALESIAYQITDIVRAMEQDAGVPLKMLRADGGATRNGYLMQFQSDILGADVSISDAEELSGIGAAYMAGLAFGIYDKTIFEMMSRTICRPAMPSGQREERYQGWQSAVRCAMEMQGR